MGSSQHEKKGRGHGGSKRKYIQTFGGDRNVAMPYGKQGILVTLLSPNLSRAGREAVNVFTEAWEELLARGVKQGPYVAPVLPSNTDSAAEPQAQTDAAAPDEGQEEQPPAKAARKGDGSADTPAETPNQAPETAAAPAEADEGGSSDGDGAGDALDFGQLISSEVKDLKDKKKRPFVVHDTGIKTCMFLGMPLVSEATPGPCEVVTHVLRKAKESRVLRMRHCLRLLPCTHIVRSEVADVTAAAKAAVEMSIDCSADATPVTAAVLYEHRAAPPAIERKALIDLAIAHVPRPPHSVKLKGATCTISLQVLRNSCGVAVLKDYDELKKYNIKTLCLDPQEGKAAEDKGGPDATAATEAAKASE
eukprot:jgi/Ulvmu1/2784/UM140_0014.1